MAEKLKTTTQNEAESSSNWPGVDYAIYGKSEKGEREYINEKRVSRETAAEAKALRIRLQGIGAGALRSLQLEAA